MRQVEDEHPRLDAIQPDIDSISYACSRSNAHSLDCMRAEKGRDLVESGRNVEQSTPSRIEWPMYKYEF